MNKTPKPDPVQDPEDYSQAVTATKEFQRQAKERQANKHQTKEQLTEECQTEELQTEERQTEERQTEASRTEADYAEAGRLLLQAVLYDNTELVQDLLQAPPPHSLAATDSHGHTALLTAVTNNSFECAHLLLQAGADPNLASGSKSDKKTPLHLAVTHNKYKFVALLMDYEGRPELRDGSGSTALDLALRHHSEECHILLTERSERNRRERQKTEQDFVCAVVSGDVDRADTLRRSLPDEGVTSLVNAIPPGQNSLLYRACEKGFLSMVQFLLNNGALIQVHPVTGYSPLHAACHSGNVDCAQALLQNVPELIGAPTIEGTFPLHMACAEGQIEILRLLLDFPYPDLVRKLYKESQGVSMYQLGMPVNSRDGHGRTPLHVAASSNKPDVVRLLLKYRVPVIAKYKDGNIENVPGDENTVNSLGESCDQPAAEDLRLNTLSSPRALICPVQVDILDLDGHTPLHVAVKGNSKLGFHKVARLLLQHKADANKPFVTPMGNSSPLMEACHLGDVDMMALLLKYGARDDNLRVLNVALKTKNWDMVGAIIQHKSHVDSEVKINIQELLKLYSKLEGQEILSERYDSCMTTSKIIRMLWPQKAVVINWHSLHLPQLEIDWFYKACWLLMGQPPADVDPRLTLFSITRLDVSNNCLKTLTAEIFEMQSLKILNASKNQIEDILMDNDIFGLSTDQKDSMNDSVQSQSVFKSNLSSSVLEEINLQNNKLRSLPADLFTLGGLVRLNVSHNCLESLPYTLWSSSSLTEINLSHNNLSLLPMSYCPSPSSEIPIGWSPVRTDHKFGSLPADLGAWDKLSPSRASLGVADSTLPSPLMSDRPDKQVYQDVPVVYLNNWANKLKICTAQEMDTNSTNMDNESKLTELNLSHNVFQCVPPGLACLVPHLNKLNLAHNKLTQVGPLNHFPAALKWLDLSHNLLVCDVKPDSVDTGPCGDDAPGTPPWNVCHNMQARPSPSSRPGSGRRSFHGQPSSQRNSGISSCAHRAHQQLDKLRTLRLAANKLDVLVLTVLEKEQCSSDPQPTGQNKRSSKVVDETRELLYPSLSALDVSHNCLTSLPATIRLQTQLAELRVAANRLRELPSELGLLKKLWNLDCSGCPIEKNLQAVLGDKAKKTASVLSYLRSIKEEAMQYNRMKLMFVGIQGIGKTSLLAQIRREAKSSSVVHKNWAQRMRNSHLKDKDVKGENLSTVGIDIGDLVLQRGGKEIVFSTWDFGGQKEYYATHQYFLSTRSLYIVMWRLTDGEKGLNQLMEWLVSIQARAPNAPVLIVGTHLDLVTRKSYPADYVSTLQRLLVARYLSHTEPDKAGLPRIVGHLEVSCRSRLMYNNHISDLTNLIWDTAWAEQLPGNKSAKLLEQKIPTTYVHLEEVVRILASERKREGKDPVLHAEQYKPLVQHKMEQMYNTSFRDLLELNHATQFLHENGVLLHYDDVSLQDIYFLDPQWLCDILSSVITIREINSFAKRGMMKTDDLKILFRNAAFRSEDIKTYIINLLSKFEVALQWGSENLLIPSLLPAESCVDSGPRAGPALLTIPLLTSSANSDVGPSPADVVECGPQQTPESSLCSDSNPAVATVRLYIMSYFPTGFWSRLLVRLLGDVSVGQVAGQVYEKVDLGAGVPGLRWRCWQTGVELLLGTVSMLKVRQVTGDPAADFCDYRQSSLVIKQDQDLDWQLVSLSNMSMLEVIVPNHAVSTGPGHSVVPSPQHTAALFTKIIEHLDTLLEDWYPDLGARFIQNARGMYLVSRIVPCTRCLLQQLDRPTMPDTHGSWDALDQPGLSQGPDATPQNTNTIQQPHRIYCYLIEQCLLAAQMNKIVFCVEHGNLGPYFIAGSSGEIMAAHVAPDTVFQDLSPHCVVAEDFLTRGHFLGRGTFGAVYSGVMVHKESGEKLPVAMKMLQPVKPEAVDDNSTLMLQYQSDRVRWSKAPLKSACEAYLTARKELSILLALSHAHIVALLGVTLRPLSLVLHLAPHGALSDHLGEYLRAGARLRPLVITAIIAQVASALDYLHSCHIIYRDLKSENVLVWRLPGPYIAAHDGDVTVKLADYGVSRCVLQSGTKGLAGTPPFIAPEIIQHNGEEAYTEKVDLFSFAMLMYELLVLRLPFEGAGSEAVGSAHLKGHILAGGRPHLTPQDLHYPSHLFDLMTQCWSSEPGERPSAGDIVGLAACAEFSRLYTVIPLEGDIDVLCAASSQSLQPVAFYGEGLVPYEAPMVPVYDVWLASEGPGVLDSGLMVLSWDAHECTHAKSLPLESTAIVCLCPTENHMWAADATGVIHVFMLNEYSEVLKFPGTTRPGVRVACMCYCPGDRHMYVVLDNASFLLCDTDLPGHFSVNYSPIKTECPGNGKPIHSLGVISNTVSSELWCGQPAGYLTVWDLHATSGSVRRLRHGGIPEHELGNVLRVVTCPGDSQSVWTSVCPGKRIYRWDVSTKKNTKTLDLSVYQTQQNFDVVVTALVCVGAHVYAGVRAGRVFVLDKLQLQVLQVLGQHGGGPVLGQHSGGPVLAVLPLAGPQEDAATPYIVTVTRGYRSIMDATADTPQPQTDTKPPVYALCYAADCWEVNVNSAL